MVDIGLCHVVENKNINTLSESNETIGTYEVHLDLFVSDVVRLNLDTSYNLQPPFKKLLPHDCQKKVVM